MNFFGSSKSSSSSSSPSAPPNKEQLRGWISSLKKEQRLLAREQAALQREEMKMKQELKKTAKSSATHSRACAIMAKSIVQSQHQQEKLLMAQTQINSVILNLKTSAASVNVVGHLSQSSTIMKSMSALISIPSIAATAREMSKEMHKTGMIDEMVNDALGMDDEELVSEADAEVDRVLFELTDGMLGKMQPVNGNRLIEEKDVQEKKIVNMRTTAV